MKKKWIWIGAAALACFGLAVFALNRVLTGLAEKRAADALSEQFDSDIQISSLRVRVFPLMEVSGEGLVMHHKGRRDVPPLIRIERLRADAGFLGLFRSPRRVRSVRIEGLEIHVPPGNDEEAKKLATGEPRKQESPVVVGEVVSENATLKILPKEAGKEPLTFHIRNLKMESVGLDRPARFAAKLTNPRPEGWIEAQGDFGPWQKAEPGLTPVTAEYTFTEADLGVFKGLEGTLASEGKFSGPLQGLVVEGETRTPDFTLSVSGHPVNLETVFKAVVDGTNGNTLLKPVRAKFGNTVAVADGGVVKTPGAKGRTVRLDVTVNDGRIEDMMRLAVKSSAPPMTGAITFRTDFELPPGEAAVAERLRLSGRFGIADAQFTNLDVREKLRALSRSGKGEPDNPDAGSAVSQLEGRFRLSDGVIRFEGLRFRVDGAAVHLNGTYGLLDEKLDFRGSLRLDASVSKATTGVKSVFLKLFDPLFRKKGAGAVIPIKVGGTREKPSFGLDAARAIGGGS